MCSDKTIDLKTVNGWAILPSSLKHPDGTPRFNLNFLTNFAGDPGAQHLIVNETGGGYEPPTRDLIERVLRRGDLFVDVGAHWGFFSLQAATHPAGDIDVVAFEPDLMNAVMLTENVGRNKLSNAITIVCAACGHKDELAPLMTNSTMGHSIGGVGLPSQAKGPSKWVSAVTLDGALTTLQRPAEQRIILKIDAEGFEPNIIVGAKSLLSGGRVALTIWECGPAFTEGDGRRAMVQMVAFLSARGFSHFRPPENDQAGPPVKFDAAAAYIGNVFSVGPQLMNDPSFASGAA